MSTMRDALLKAGLLSVSEHAARSQQDTQFIKARAKEDQRRTMKDLDPTLDNLAACSTVNQFRALAGQILAKDPSTIGQVLKLGHDLKQADGGSRLVWQIFQIRDVLPTVAPVERERFVKRALRRAGGLGSHKMKEDS